MDLLFSKYADPFLLLNQMILFGAFTDFVRKLFELDNEKQKWEFYLHKVMDQSYEDFKRSLNSSETKMTKHEKEDTVKDAFTMLKGFNPEGGKQSVKNI